MKFEKFTGGDVTKILGDVHNTEFVYPETIITCPKASFEYFQNYFTQVFFSFFKTRPVKTPPLGPVGAPGSVEG